ncbi:MAG TPA: triple tyrosine motif-containing protein [Pyrinomonadaceae bacterium]|nr:triple tyrosine motif-containing protein [Pyrinomonadaceae bacterium]
MSRVKAGQLLFYSCYCVLLALGILLFRSSLAESKSQPAQTSTPTQQSSTSSKLQLGHDSWGFKEGAPNEVSSLAQTNDGYLWLASPSGLFRFDGERFERYRPPSGAELISMNISCLFAPSSGGLWIGYRFGSFSFLKDGRLTNYTSSPGATGTILEIVQDHDGILWASSNSGIWRLEHSEWQRLGAEWNPPNNILNIAFDRAGYLWVLTRESLIYLAPGAKRFEVTEAAGYVKSVGAPVGSPSDFGFTYDADGFVVTSQSWKPRNAPENGGPPAYPLISETTYVVIHRTGGLWFVYRDLSHMWPAGSVEDALKAATLKLTKVSPEQISTWKVVPGDSSSVENFSIETYRYARLVDREGNIWFGGPKGIYRFFYKPFVQPTLEPLGDAVGIVSDGEGGIWAGGQNSPLFHLGARQQKIPGTDAWSQNAAYLAPDNTLWMASSSSGLWHETLSKVRPTGESDKWFKIRNALFEYTGRNWDFVALPPDLADRIRFLQAITQDRKGGLWISMGRRGVYRFADGSWTLNGGRNDFPKNTVLSEFTDTTGRVWFGFLANQLAVLEGDNLRVFGSNDGLRVGNVLVVAGRGADVWIGGDLGLQRYHNGRLVTINAVDNEMVQGISGIIERANGDLWLNGITGVFHISQAEVSRALQDPAHRVTGEHFGRREGLPGYAPQVRPLTSAVESPDGRLWFAVNNGVVWVDPNHSEHPATALPISIQSVYVDDKYYELGAPLRFPAHTSNVEISYVAVSLSAPERVRYRYKLHQTDKDWREVRTAEPVTFRNLPPGSYHFVVAASDTNGAWSDKVAGVEFTILPAFYQTIWFRLAMIATGLLLVFGLYRLRLRQATVRLNARFDERLAERTRIARELHDTLLQTVQGSKLVADNALEKPNDAGHLHQAMRQLSGWLGQATQEGRAALNSLRTSTVDTNDLAEGLRRATEECVSDRSIAVKFSATGGPRDLHPIAREEIYRIGYEAIRNACEHAAATELEIVLTYAQDLTLRVSDNGTGMEAAVLKEGKEGHFGLQGMRERAARIGSKFTLNSASNSGTEMTLVVPGNVIFRKASATRFERIKTFFRLDRSSDLH